MLALPNLGTSLNAYGSPIEVVTIAKLTKWSNLQTLGHDASLKDSSLTFHGLKDARNQWDIYTQGNPNMLSAGWQAIKQMVLQNWEIMKTMVVDPTLGPVGPSVAEIPSMGAVFSGNTSTLGTGSKAVASTLSS
jgi:hypothetical protein